MLQYEIIDNGERIRHWSDENYYLKQVETNRDRYEDAVDVLPCQYTYEETDEPIIQPDPEPENILADEY